MEQRVTMKEIARQLHVSLNAVSLALNDKSGVGKETRNRILNKAEELGYFKSKSKYKKALANKNICLMIPAQYFLKSDFYSKIVLGIENEAQKNGYEVLVNFPDQFQNVLECLDEGRACGIISVGRIRDFYLLKLRHYGIPLVLVDHMSLTVPSDCILSNNRQGSYGATRLLIENGYRQIGFFGDLDYSMSIKERYAGYADALHTLPFLADYSDTVQYTFHYSALKGIEKDVIHHNLDGIVGTVKKIQEMPQAFVCSNDEAAVLLIHALQKLHYRVPEDIAVVGFDNTALAATVRPSLTTVNIHRKDTGAAAVDHLLWRLHHRNEPSKNIVLNVEVVVRDSISKLVN